MSVRNLDYKIKQEDEGKLVKELLKDQLHLSRREISHAKAFEDGILIDGKHVNVLYKVSEGELLHVSIHENTEASAQIVPMEGELDIVYEDEEFVSLESSYDKDGKTSYGDIMNVFVKEIIKTGGCSGIKRHKGSKVVAK